MSNAGLGHVFEFSSERKSVVGVEIVSDSQTTAEAAFIAVQTYSGQTGKIRVKALNRPSYFRGDVNSVVRSMGKSRYCQ